MCRRLLAVVAFVAAILLPARSPAASVTLSRESSLSATGQTSDDSFDLSDALDTFGPYDNSMGDSIDVPAGGATRAQASQESNVVAGIVGGFARGAAEAQVAEFDAIAAQGESSFELVFDVLDEDETLRLAGSVNASLDATSQVSLFRQGDIDPLFAQFGVADGVSFDEPLTLTPGHYTLRAEAIVTGTPVPGEASYAVNFNLVGGVNPIPLPPAIWAGSGGLVIAMLCARRVARRIRHC